MYFVRGCCMSCLHTKYQVQFLFCVCFLCVWCGVFCCGVWNSGRDACVVCVVCCLKGVCFLSVVCDVCLRGVYGVYGVSFECGLRLCVWCVWWNLVVLCVVVCVVSTIRKSLTCIGIGVNNECQ